MSKAEEKQKKENLKLKVIIELFKIVFFRKDLATLKRYEKNFLCASTLCSKFTPVYLEKGVILMTTAQKIKTAKENPLFRSYYIFKFFRLSIIFMTLFWLSISVYMMMENYFILFYFKNIVLGLVNDISSGSEISLGSVLLEGTFFYEKFIIRAAAILITYLLIFFIVKRGVNGEFFKRNNRLRELILASGYIKEETFAKNPDHFLLWTPVGILVDVDSRSNEELEKDSSFWVQMEMIAGKSDVSGSRHLFFLNVGFKLPDYLQYSYENNKPVTYFSKPKIEK